MDAFKKGEYAKTVELTSKAKPRDADYAKLTYLAAEAHLRLEQWTDAEAKFRVVLEKRPEAAPAFTGLGKALAELGKDEDAEKQLRTAVEKDPKDAQAHAAVGEFLLKRERTGDALKALKKANGLAPNDPLIVRPYVAVLLASDDEKKAGKVAGKLAKALPKHPMGHFLEGLVLDRRGKDKDAIEAYEKAIALDETFLDAHKNLAILCTTQNPLYSDKERTEKAFRHYEKYFELGGNDPELEQTYRTIKGYLEQYAK
jgi:Flp pilus assembly protein TadD